MHKFLFSRVKEVIAFVFPVLTLLKQSCTQFLIIIAAVK